MPWTTKMYESGEHPPWRRLLETILVQPSESNLLHVLRSGVLGARQVAPRFPSHLRRPRERKKKTESI